MNRRRTAASGGRGREVAMVDVRDASRPGGARFGELVARRARSAPLAATALATRRPPRRSGAHSRRARRGTRCAAVDARHARAEPRAAAARGRRRLRAQCPSRVSGDAVTAPDGRCSKASSTSRSRSGEWMVVDFKTDREISEAGSSATAGRSRSTRRPSRKATGRPAVAFQREPPTAGC